MALCTSMQPGFHQWQVWCCLFQALFLRGEKLNSRRAKKYLFRLLWQPLSVARPAIRSSPPTKRAWNILVCCSLFSRLYSLSAKSGGVGLWGDKSESQIKNLIKSANGIFEHDVRWICWKFLKTFDESLRKIFLLELGNMKKINRVSCCLVRRFVTVATGYW